jgi:hypothetical protein
VDGIEAGKSGDEVCECQPSAGDQNDRDGGDPWLDDRGELVRKEALEESTDGDAQWVPTTRAIKTITVDCHATAAANCR